MDLVQEVIDCLPTPLLCIVYTYAQRFCMVVLPSKPSVACMPIRSHAIAQHDNGDLFVLNKDTNQVVRFSNEGKFILKWGKTGLEQGQFQELMAATCLSTPHILVSDIKNQRVERFTLDGEWCSTFMNTGLKNMCIDQGKLLCSTSDHKICSMDVSESDTMYTLQYYWQPTGLALWKDCYCLLRFSFAYRSLLCLSGHSFSSRQSMKIPLTFNHAHLAASSNYVFLADADTRKINMLDWDVSSKTFKQEHTFEIPMLTGSIDCFTVNPARDEMHVVIQQQMVQIYVDV
jgi:hypothetical protein